MENRFFEISAPGIRCTLCDAGASIARVSVRDARGAWIDVALPCDSYYSGKKSPSSAGRTIGPCCGRVKAGEARIDGKSCQLTRNEGKNHLHGGEDGCASRRWTVVEQSPERVRFGLELPDGLEGYPGNRSLTSEYAVEGNALRVTYGATTDRTTFIDMTNHVYWDLGGRFDGSAMEQSLQIAAKQVVHNDAAHLPVAIVDVDDAMDFSAPCAPAQKLRDHGEHDQLRIGHGFNNGYVLDPALTQSLGYSARLSSPLSGVAMTMTTDQPAIVLYSGGFLNARTELCTPPGAASPGCAIALEAQGLPDPFHLPGAEAAPLKPGERYRREIEWRFQS